MQLHLLHGDSVFSETPADCQCQHEHKEVNFKPLPSFVAIMHSFDGLVFLWATVYAP
jgi:hypothetical protein